MEKVRHLYKDDENSSQLAGERDYKSVRQEDVKKNMCRKNYFHAICLNYMKILKQDIRMKKSAFLRFQPYGLSIVS